MIEPTITDILLEMGRELAYMGAVNRCPRCSAVEVISLAGTWRGPLLCESCAEEG